MIVPVHLLALALLTGGQSTHPDGRACADTTGVESTFEFASSPWLNLYNFLFKAAKQSRGIEDEGLGARGYVAEDTAAVRVLTPAERREWNAAVELFARSVLTDRMGIDSLVLNVNDALARVGPGDDLQSARLHPELRRVLQAVMPIYRTAWWPTHDRRNQEWITSMRVGLANHESCLIRRATAVFRAPWPSTPLRVDAAVYASWFGAYSTRPPTRITVAANARGTQGSYGVEVLLHEAAHGMLAPLDSALGAEAARNRKTLPAELSHLVLFYTAGALMRELDGTYAPFAEQFGVWNRTRLTKRYRVIIEREWQPYLSGSRSFAEAVAGVVSQLD